MGQVTKDEFDVSGGTVTFTLNVQDTVGVKELWILDFQPYLYDVDALPIDPNTGRSRPLPVAIYKIWYSVYE